MKGIELGLPGLFRFTPMIHTDTRGLFLESFKASVFEATTGRHLDLRQSNISVSRRGTVRGLHFAQVPPGQGKYVECVSGAILDVAVDIRVGSPSFGHWEAVRLDDDSREALFISEGLAHGFCALSASATVAYMCTEPFAPSREFGIHPLDQELGLPWPTDLELLISEKDATAPTLTEAARQGMLPTYADCLHVYTPGRGRIS
jgi:dTDP-4-dehydrorhamnose 3,5-epimerase